MKRTILPLIAIFLSSYGMAQETMTREANNTYVIRTTQLSEGIRGYSGPVPIKMIIQKGKILSVEMLENKETPGYRRRVESQLLPLYTGMKVKDCRKQQPDAVTGATFTVRALQENVRLAIEYYEKNK